MMLFDQEGAWALVMAVPKRDKLASMTRKDADDCCMRNLQQEERFWRIVDELGENESIRRGSMAVRVTAWNRADGVRIIRSGNGNSGGGQRAAGDGRTP